MKLDLEEIKEQLTEYHLQVAEIVSGLDAELENQKKEIRGIKRLEIELLKLTARIENLEKIAENENSSNKITK